MSYYNILGGIHPFSKSEMKNNIVDKVFGNGNYTEVPMFVEDENGRSKCNEKYDKVKAEFVASERLYLSASHQGSAYINAGGDVIQASVLGYGSIESLFFVKNK